MSLSTRIFDRFLTRKNSEDRMHFRETFPARLKQQRFAIRLSLVVGLVMLAGKWFAFLLTDSASIFSDAAE